MPSVIDCQGLAGHVSLGAVQAGFHLTHRASLRGGFGDDSINANRHLVGDDWAQDPGGSAAEWEPVTGSLLIGTPPCSGFSVMNTAKQLTNGVSKNSRGPDSAINECMRELVSYAARCDGEDGRRGVPIVIFESVQQAYTQGRGLMQKFRALIEERTGESYDLTHVLMSGASVGAGQRRHRYFFVAHRIPFGVEHPEQRVVAVNEDVIGDLRGLTEQWELQPYGGPTNPYLEEQLLRDAPGVTQHISPREQAAVRVYLETFLPYWNPGEGTEPVLRRYIEAGNPLPPRAEKWWDFEKNEQKGWGGARMIRPDVPGFVLTGGALYQFLHWEEPRMLTVRECTRLMGLPDSWEWPHQHLSRISAYIGKCAPVPSGRWISGWAKRAIEGTPGPLGDTIGEREYLHNSSNTYKQWPHGVLQRGATRV